MKLCLGIDVGTSGVRMAVMNGNELVSMTRAEHLPKKRNEIDANDWWSAVENCLRKQIADLKEKRVDPLAIRGIAVDGTSGSMVLTNAALTPVSPGLMYNSSGFDTEAAIIAQQAPKVHITQGTNSALARAMRLVRLSVEPPAHLLHQADFIAAKLMAKGGHSDFNNALKTGFDPEPEMWPDWIGAVIDPAILPKVHNPGAPIAKISKKIALEFELSPDTIIHAGTTDSIAAFLACAPLEEGVAVTSLGSTLAIKLLNTKRIDDPAVGLYSHKLNNLWLVGGASNTGGAVLKAFFSDEDLRALSQQIDINNPTHLGFYPLLAKGERFPINDPDLAPKLAPRPKSDARFLQAILEGITDIEARCYDAIAARGGRRPKKIITAGGGAQNETWTALRARIIGIPLGQTKQPEAAIGAASLVLDR
ncbi:MAG: FGGY-family carbohydrate kinase [Pseudoprimorskyibacter sp.]|nr:FGGY-family carbohydrate kinase [Pseudoprimorskyibacter sp.]